MLVGRICDATTAERAESLSDEFQRGQIQSLENNQHSHLSHSPMFVPDLNDDSRAQYTE